MTYLSIAPEGLREAFITGGLSPIGRPVDDVYRRRTGGSSRRNERYFERYPEDRARVAEILGRLDGEDVRLQTGDRLTARRFRQLGSWLGDSAGWELLHHVLELPFGSPRSCTTSRRAVRFARNPIYATLHESSYADGVATRWSAERLLPDEIRDGVAFTAEHVFPLDVRRLPVAPAAQGGGRDPRRARLAAALRRRRSSRVNEVPVAATIYVDDLYVEREFAEETAAAIRGLRPWITERVRAQRPARRRRARARPADRPGPRPRLSRARPTTCPRQPVLHGTTFPMSPSWTRAQTTPRCDLGLGSRDLVGFRSVRNGRYGAPNLAGSSSGGTCGFRPRIASTTSRADAGPVEIPQAP